MSERKRERGRDAGENTQRDKIQNDKEEKKRDGLQQSHNGEKGVGDQLFVFIAEGDVQSTAIDKRNLSKDRLTNPTTCQ